MEPREYSDEELVVYLDGQMDAAERAVLQEAAKSDPVLAERIDALRIDTGALQAGFGALLSEAPELYVSQTQPTGDSGWGRGWVAAAAAALFAMGLGLGWQSSPPGGADPWLQAVADYQVLYTTDTLAGAPTDAAGRAPGLALASERIGLDLTETLLSVEGLSLQRAQVLSFEDKPLVQVAYLTDAGDPVAFCFMKGSGEETPESIELSGLNATVWSRGGYRYVLIGPTDSGFLRAAAIELSQRVQG
jgi:anti-sigma factor RsiW